MEYESASSTAQRLGVTARAVQKWAKEGKIPGAKQMGRQWLIPAGTKGPQEVCNNKVDLCVHPVMPLLSNTFVPGSCRKLIESFQDSDDRAIAEAEYCYYRGNTDKAMEILEPYLDSYDYGLRLSANFIYTFASLKSCKSQLVRFNFANTEKCVKSALEINDSPKLRAFAVFVGTATRVLLHREIGALPALESVMAELPEGLRLFSAYIIAHRLYLNKEYNRAIGVADICLAMRQGDFPVASLYLKLIKCVCYMALKDSVNAKKSFNDINRIALREKFYQPFVEHHGLLQGIIEAELKSDFKESYSDIISQVRDFSTGWRMLHNEIANSKVTVNLSANEFVVAMLFNRGWSVKEIAAHLEISTRMVKHHLSVTYEKLDVSNREELGQYLLK